MNYCQDNDLTAFNQYFNSQMVHFYYLASHFYTNLLLTKEGREGCANMRMAGNVLTIYPSNNYTFKQSNNKDDTTARVVVEQLEHVHSTLKSEKVNVFVQRIYYIT